MPETQTNIEVIVFASQMENPTIVDEACTFVGSLIITINKDTPISDQTFHVSGLFGQTEIRIEVTTLNLGISMNAIFDML